MFMYAWHHVNHQVCCQSDVNAMLVLSYWCPLFYLLHSLKRV